MAYKLVLIFWLLFSPFAIANSESVKIRSVKYLTYILSQAEKQSGNGARFTTLRLQLYIEDIYLSQGDTIYINQQALIRYIRQASSQGVPRADMASELLAKFQQGEFDG